MVARCSQTGRKGVEARVVKGWRIDGEETWADVEAERIETMQTHIV